MKLCFSPTSPYVRKVRACAITREINGQIELVPTDANASPADFVAINPLSKVPALVTEDGAALFDSPVICEYLDSVGDALPMFPTHGAARWRALKLQAMGDGILDASVPRRGELMKPCKTKAAWRGSRGAEGRSGSNAGCTRSRSAASHGRHRFHHHRLRTGLSGFPLRRATMAANASEACRMVRSVRAEPWHRRHRPEGPRLNATPGS